MSEEEAAILSIGARLEWKPVVSFTVPEGDVLESAQLDTGKCRQNYSIELNSNDSPQVKAEVFYFKKNEYPSVTPEYWYKTVAEAKAACEIHAATGQFPPSVEAVETA